MSSIKPTITPIPFDPEKLDEGWIVRTRDGREVKQLTVFNAISTYQVYGVIGRKLEAWTLDGNWHTSHDDDRSLVMYPPE